MSTPAIMVLGTGSHVGKSLITAALCRIFARHGVRVAPFKSQNMSLNFAATPEGLEIGRAQALQAEAAGIRASVHMNPILIKPSGKGSSQVVVQGRFWAQLSAADYYQRRVTELLPIVRESYSTLAADHDLMLLEGAGSPAEINLKQNDIVNMRMAEMARARCILVGDIDRGGVFASVLGTLELLDPDERARIGGFVVNKFRGDQQLLAPGIEAIERRVGNPVLGSCRTSARWNWKKRIALGCLVSKRFRLGLQAPHKPAPNALSESGWSLCPRSQTSPTWTPCVRSLRLIFASAAPRHHWEPLMLLFSLGASRQRMICCGFAAKALT